jgi:hypothetical protein
MPDAATPRARACSPTCQTLQPYVLHAATLCTQVTLAEHKPAWDAALREVVDLAFAFGSTLPEVSEAILTLTLTLALTLTLIQTLTPNPNQVSEVIVEQLLEGAHLAS